MIEPTTNATSEGILHPGGTCIFCWGEDPDQSGSANRWRSQSHRGIRAMRISEPAAKLQSKLLGMVKGVGVCI
jgi:hypothetical protein